MNTLYVLCGLPGSGKTAYSRELAKETNAKLHEYDELKRSLNSEDHKLIEHAWLSNMRSDLSEGYDVICDNTSLTKEWRIGFLHKIYDIPCKKVLIVMDTPIEKCVENNKNRIHTIPTIQIYMAAEFFEKPSYDEGWNEIRIVTN